MSQRPVSYAGKRIAPSRRSVPPRKAPFPASVAVWPSW